MIIETYTDRCGNTIELEDAQWLEDKLGFNGEEYSRYAVTDTNGNTESVWLDEFDTEIEDPLL